MTVHRITLIPGDGAGPELVDAARVAVEATGVEIEWDVQPAGLSVIGLVIVAIVGLIGAFGIIRLGITPTAVELLRILLWVGVTIVYVAMYLVLIAQPIVGWLMSTAFGFPVVYLGLVPVPAPVSEDRALAERLQGVHETLAYVLVLLFAAHLSGVLYHHLVRRDAVLSRMLPSVAPPPGGSA